MAEGPGEGTGEGAGSGSVTGSGAADYRLRRLLEAYYDLTLQMQDRLQVRDVSDVLMLVLVAVGDLRGAPVDAELLAEKLDSSRSTVERRLRPYLERGLVSKGRRGKSVVFQWTPAADAAHLDDTGAPGAPPDMSADMVRALMRTVFDIAND
ncbi:hypothetical protein [Stappia sp.]|uniref:hypothetical protein n=1 Tax=Stappia sp. TaxID=1870903 RepID=UPI0032D94CDC